MHTSTRLCAEDFHFWQQMPGAAQEVDFATFSPDYHVQDRVGVVSPALEDGVLHTSYALLALTTAFYDRMRARSNDFFDYPQHFAFVGAESRGLYAGGSVLPATTPHLWEAWSWLDVWPDAKWVTAPTTASAMLQRVLDYQINRLFWPRALRPSSLEAKPPAHLWKMLRTSLKAVYLYGEADYALGGIEGERVEIRVMEAAQRLVEESVERLPATLQTPGIASWDYTPQVYELVAVDDFLTAMQL